MKTFLKKNFVLLGLVAIHSNAWATNAYLDEFNKQFVVTKLAYDMIQSAIRKIQVPFGIATANGLVIYSEHDKREQYRQQATELENIYRDTAIRPLADQYSWAIPNDQAIQTIVKYGPIVEIGAGSGYWASLVSDQKVDVVAYDDFSWQVDGKHKTAKQWFDVKKGDESQASGRGKRTLFLCWPVKESINKFLMAAKALSQYEGKYLIYVGEIGDLAAMGGAVFFTKLRLEFDLVETVDIPQWPGYNDKLYVFKRKKNRIAIHADQVSRLTKALLRGYDFDFHETWTLDGKLYWDDVYLKRTPQ